MLTTLYTTHLLNKYISDWQIPDHNWDVVPTVSKFEHGYWVDITSFAKGEDPPSGPLRVYTDGSRAASRSGAGFVVLKNDTILDQCSFPLVSYLTVFQAEVFAIGLAARHVCEQMGRGATGYSPTAGVVLLSDSQAAIQALNSPFLSSKIVLDTTTSLDASFRRSRYVRSKQSIA